MCIDYAVFANQPFYRRCLSICGIWYPWKFVQEPVDNKGWLYWKTQVILNSESPSEESMNDEIFLCWKWLGSFGKLWWLWPLNEFHSAFIQEGPSSALLPLHTSLTFRNEAQMGKLRPTRKRYFLCECYVCVSTESLKTNWKYLAHFNSIICSLWIPFTVVTA